MEERANELRGQIHARLDEVAELASEFWKNGRAHTAAYEEGLSRLLSDYRRSADVRSWLGEQAVALGDVDAVLVRLLEERLALLDEVLATWRTALGV